MNLKAVYTTSGIFKVHAADCSDLNKLTGRQGASMIPVAGTDQDIAVSLMADLIDEGSIDADEALDYVRFLPCSGR